jgi:hypothetical protein
MRTAMTDQYANNREREPSRSTFNVSCSHKTTWNVSNIIPVYWDILYPGEVRRGTTRCFIRLSNPLEFPLMDNAYVTIHVFSVAIRNLWTNFRKFWGERENPADSIDYTIPTLTGTINMTTWGLAERLLDHLGVPHLTAVDGTDISALPCRAYNNIWDYWYRDSSIQNSIVGTGTGDGPDTHSFYVLKQRGKRWDYFTNVLPEPQRGESTLIGGEIATPLGAGGNPSIYSDADAGFKVLDSNLANVDVSATGGSINGALYPNTTINELRNAVAIQQFLERDNRAGQLFGDIIEAHYSANFQDAKYAPSYIAGGRAPFVFSAIPNQAADSGATGSEKALGELGSIGTGVFEGASFTYRAQEPEILMIMAMVDADLTYHQGLDRKFSYRTRYDFMWPEFQGVGDQPLLTKELYYTNTSTDDTVFGYSPRYEECRTGINRLSGEFRPDYATSLDSWHLAQDFTSTPTLNSGYIISAPPFDRVMINSTVDNILADFHFEQYSTKPLSATGVPGLARL